MNYEAEKTELRAKQYALILQKKELEIKLCAVKNEVRSGGRMPGWKYKDCCNRQSKYQSQVVQVELQLIPINQRLHVIADLEYYEKKQAETGKCESKSDPNTCSSIVAELNLIRNEYEKFASDHTRVSSMKTMAAEFALKLDGVIKRAINPR